MFVHIVVAGLLLAGLVLLAIFAVILSHYVLIHLGRSNRLHKNQRRRIPGYFIAAGLAFMQLISELYYPSAAYVLREIRDEDEAGDPESTEKQLSHQLKRIRRGENVGDLVLRL